MFLQMVDRHGLSMSNRCWRESFTSSFIAVIDWGTSPKKILGDRGEKQQNGSNTSWTKCANHQIASNEKHSFGPPNMWYSETEMVCASRKKLFWNPIINGCWRHWIHRPSRGFGGLALKGSSLSSLREGPNTLWSWFITSSTCRCLH